MDPGTLAQDEVDLAATRIAVEEGFRAFPYNDATGKRVSCQPEGNLTWLCGINLETEGSEELAGVLLHWKLAKIRQTLLPYAWFSKCNVVRRSALLDVAFNAGVNGLLHYPQMLAAIAADDWETAKAQCHSKDPRLAARYAVLAELIFRGEP